MYAFKNIAISNMMILVNQPNFRNRNYNQIQNYNQVHIIIACLLQFVEITGTGIPNNFHFKNRKNRAKQKLIRSSDPN